MNAPVFVDTNVLVYDRDEREPVKHARARAWMAALWRRPGLGVVGGQVLTEFYWTVTRKLRPGLPEEEARKYVRTLGAWPLVPIDEGVILESWVVQDRYGFSFWDALVVAAARTAGCRCLLTEDLQHGQDLDGLLVVDPFLESPESLSE
jgi:predicted nucleic acid-binding protein